MKLGSSQKYHNAHAQRGDLCLSTALSWLMERGGGIVIVMCRNVSNNVLITIAKEGWLLLLWHYKPTRAFAVSIGGFLYHTDNW